MKKPKKLRRMFRRAIKRRGVVACGTAGGFRCYVSLSRILSTERVSDVMEERFVKIAEFIGYRGPLFIEPGVSDFTPIQPEEKS